MKFHFIAQFEIAYLKDNQGDIVRKYYAPKKHFFVPGTWSFENFPKDFALQTITFEEFKQILQGLDEQDTAA